MPTFTVRSKVAEKPNVTEKPKMTERPRVSITKTISKILPKEPPKTVRTFHVTFRKQELLETVEALHRAREAHHASKRKLARLVLDKSEQDRQVEVTTLLAVIEQQKNEEDILFQKMNTLK